jgi:hypothetical protein
MYGHLSRRWLQNCLILVVSRLGLEPRALALKGRPHPSIIHALLL